MIPPGVIAFEFLIIAEAGELERQALLLAESIRRFGGRYSHAQITALQPRTERKISEHGRQRLAALDVSVVDLSIISPSPGYGTSYRIFACAEYERRATSDCLIFLDSDIILLAEPDLELGDADVAAKPVDVKGMCTSGKGDINETYWRALCRLCEVDYEQIPFVTSTVDRAHVRASYNGGLTVVKTKAGLFTKTAEFFTKSIDAKLEPWPERTTSVQVGHGEVPPEGARLWGSSQACLSLAITALKLSVRILPPSVNFPLNFHVELLPEILAGRVPTITLLHYHHFFRESPGGNPLITGMPGLPADATQWARAHPGVNRLAGKRLVLVLGMHRSGTSALTKGLETLGVELPGELLPADDGNPKGYWEDIGFYQFNEELLGALNRNWRDIGFLDTETIAGLCEGPRLQCALDLLDARFTEAPLIGLKDPRFCLLLPFWEKVFSVAGINVSRVVIVRNPRSVAASLTQRDGLPEDLGLWLYWLYNSQLFGTSSMAPSVVVDYDELMDAPDEQLKRIARSLGLPLDAEKLKVFTHQFIDQSLRHTFFQPKAAALLTNETHAAFATYAAMRSLAQSDTPSLEKWRALPDQWRLSLGSSSSLLAMSASLFAETWRLKKVCDEQSATLIMLEEEFVSKTGSLPSRAGPRSLNEGLIAPLAERNARLEKRIRRIENSIAWRLYTPFFVLGKRIATVRKRWVKSIAG